MYTQSYRFLMKGERDNKREESKKTERDRNKGITRWRQIERRKEC